VLPEIPEHLKVLTPMLSNEQCLEILNKKNPNPYTLEQAIRIKDFLLLLMEIDLRKFHKDMGLRYNEERLKILLSHEKENV
jgi:hypothetical protein